jgi:hypothetical protein
LYFRRELEDSGFMKTNGNITNYAIFNYNYIYKKIKQSLT